VEKKQYAREGVDSIWTILRTDHERKLRHVSSNRRVYPCRGLSSSPAQVRGCARLRLCHQEPSGVLCAEIQKHRLCDVGWRAVSICSIDSFIDGVSWLLTLSSVWVADASYALHDADLCRPVAPFGRLYRAPCLFGRVDWRSFRGTTTHHLRWLVHRLTREAT
jgi:hypothetical protein